MNIGLLTTSFPRHDEDLAGTFVLGFARALAARGHSIDVLAPEPSDPPSPPAMGDDRVRVRWVPYLRPRPLERTFYGAGVPDNLRRDPVAWLGLAPFVVSLARAAREAAPAWDAIVSHWALPSGLVASEIAAGRPHLAVVHSADLHLLESLPMRGLVARRIARGASALLFVSPSHRERFLALLPALTRSAVAPRAHVCPMGIDPAPPPSSSKKTLRKQRGLDGFVALTMSRLVPIKGVDHAIRATVLDGETTLLVLGDGPERDGLAEYTRAHRARVRFEGVVFDRAKEDLLACADCFVLPSKPTKRGRTEGVPTALLEAMARGIPVIATDTGGVSSIVKDGVNGILVKAGDEVAIGRALTAFRTDDALRRRLSRQAKKTGALYLWPEIAPRLEALLAR